MFLFIAWFYTNMNASQEVLQLVTNASMHVLKNNWGIVYIKMQCYLFWNNQLALSL